MREQSTRAAVGLSSLLLSSLELSETKVMSLTHEPASEPLRIFVKWLHTRSDEPDAPGTLPHE